MLFYFIFVSSLVSLSQSFTFGSTELFNAYMHCYGCEVLLGKDLNLCLGCHASGRLAFPPLGEDEVGLTDRLHCPSIP